MPTFFRHREYYCSSTPDVQGGRTNKSTSETNSPRKDDKIGTSELSDKKGQTDRKKNRRAPDTQITDNTRNESANG